MNRLAPLILTALLCLPTAGAASGEYDPALTPPESDPRAVLVEERWPDGTIKLRRFEVDGKAHGTWQEWNEDGMPRYIGQWRDGLGEGVWTYFHPNGQIRYQAWVSRDIWHGPTEGWHANGRKAFSGLMVDGANALPFGYWDEAGAWAGPLPDPGLPGKARLFDGDWPGDEAGALPFWDFTFTRDLQTIFYAVGDAEGDNRRIMMRNWKDGVWSAPTLAPFAAIGATEGTPVVTPDGAYVIFSSDRHAAAEASNPHRDLYRASRRSGWKEVERITATPLYGEITLSLACDGRGALWTDRRLQGEEQMGLYEVRWDGEALEVIGSLNDLHTGDVSNENFTIISPDGSTLVFANYNIGSNPGDEDLFVALREGDGWSEPRVLGVPVNTPATETSPHFTGDGRLLFRSADSQGTGFFTVPLDAIGLAPIGQQTALPQPCG